MRLLITTMLSFVLLGCVNTTGVIRDGDSYRVTRTGDTGFTNSNTLERDAYQEATEFCAEQGKIVETIEVENQQARPMGGYPSARLIFKCVSR